MKKPSHFPPALLAVLFVVSHAALAGSFEESPLAWENNPTNFDNTSSAWENNPTNYDNSPDRWGNERILRSPAGEPQGYVVPREDGGYNYFDFTGTRRGYLPPPR
jgi:hypothetical protein